MLAGGREVRDPSAVDLHCMAGSLRFLGRRWCLCAGLCAGGRAHSRVAVRVAAAGRAHWARWRPEATAEAAKHGDRSEPLAALVAEARAMLEQAKAEQAERARASAEEAAAAAAVKAAAEAAVAAQRLQLEEKAAALTLRMQSDTLRLQRDALMLQQVHSQLGVPPACRPQPGCGGDAVRGVHGRAQGPHRAAVHAPVRVWAVCAAARGAGRVVPGMPRAARADGPGVLLRDRAVSVDNVESRCYQLSFQFNSLTVVGRRHTWCVSSLGGGRAQAQRPSALVEA
jgi:hypothetical protein